MAGTIEIQVFSKNEDVTYVIEIPKPHPDEVKKYSDKFNCKLVKKYHQHNYEENLKGKNDNTIKEEILKKYFQDEKSPGGFTPNKKLNEILVKVTLLNDYYNTHIDNNMLVPIARQILALDIDDKLEESVKNNKANCDLVNAIAYYRGSVNKYDRVNVAYSFASKYCSWHCPKVYPILDSYVKGLLYYINESVEDKFMFYPDNIFNKRTKRINSKNKYLNDYNIYYKAYNDFVKKYQLDSIIENKYKKIDEYLWMLTQDKLSDGNCRIKRIKNNKEIYQNYTEYKNELDDENRTKIATQLSHLVKLDGYYDGMSKKLEVYKGFKSICENCKSIEEEQ